MEDNIPAYTPVLLCTLSEDRNYDLDGRPVKPLQKGQVYIKNGHKFDIK